MAGESALLAMLGQGDLSGFTQNALAGNLFSQLAPSILGAKFDTSSWSPGTSAGVSFGKALLGGLANNYGRNQVADETSAVSKILPDLYADPMSVAAPEGVDKYAFSQLQNKAVSDNLLRTQAETLTKQNTADDLIKSIFAKNGINSPELINKIAARSSFADDLKGVDVSSSKLEGLMNAYQDKYPGLKDPNVRNSIAGPEQLHDYLQLNKDTSDKEDAKKNVSDTRLESTLRKELEKTGSPHVIATTIAPLLIAAKDNAELSQHNNQSDLNLVDIANKITNPGGVLRAQLVEQTKNANSPFNKIAGEISNVLGNGTFSDQGRQQLIDVITKLGGEKLLAGKQFADSKIAIAKNKINADAGANILDPDYYATIYGGAGSSPAAPGPSAGYTPEQARAMLKAMGAPGY